jgi:hypothetical protein
VSEERRNAGERLAVGASMIGAGHYARASSKQRNAIGTAGGELRAIRAGGPKARHAKHAATWLGTRGLVAAGIPISAVGARNLLAEKPKVSRVNIKDEVVRGTIDSTLPRRPRVVSGDAKRSRGRAAELAAVTGAGLLGGAAGTKLAARRIAHKPLAAAVGGAAGTIAGGLAAAPAARRLVPLATEGEYRHTKQGVRRVPVAKLASGDAAIKELPKTEQKQLIRRKRKQSAYSLASAGLGATALGLRAPQLARAVTKHPRLVKVRPSEAAVERGKEWSNNVGVGSIGVGSLGSLNFARIQRSEAKADQRAVAKGLLPVARPVKFGGVRRGGLRQVRTTLGVKQVLVRGSLG